MARVKSRLAVGGKNQAHHWWWFALLGVVLIAGGTFMLGNLAAATAVATIFVGAALIVVGVFQIIKAFNTPLWGGALLTGILGALYVFTGALLFWNPVLGAISLTFALAAMLIGSGLVRLWLAYEHWHVMGGLLTLSGIIGIAAGIIIFVGWPVTGLWVPGLVLAIDVLFQGFAWLMFGFAIRPR
jgi:uncharacterized membrane protein HdeD (DUF308 family)